MDVFGSGSRAAISVLVDVSSFGEGLNRELACSTILPESTLKR